MAAQLHCRTVILLSDRSAALPCCSLLQPCTAAERSTGQVVALAGAIGMEVAGTKAGHAGLA
jgi:hypothetical protein